MHIKSFVEKRQDRAWKLENIASFAKNQKAHSQKGKISFPCIYDFVKRWVGREGVLQPRVCKRKVCDRVVFSLAHSLGGQLCNLIVTTVTQPPLTSACRPLCRSLCIEDNYAQCRPLCRSRQSRNSGPIMQKLQCVVSGCRPQCFCVV